MSKHPKAFESVLNDFYADDFIVSVSICKEALELENALQILLEKWKFKLKDWISNNVEVCSYDEAQKLSLALLQ